MRVQEVMTKGVRTVPQSMPARDAWNLMKTHSIHHLVVIEGAEIVGLISDRDIGGRAGALARNGRTVEDLMTSTVVMIDHEASIRKAANVMRGRTIGCLPVTKKGRLVGIVTTADLLGLLGHGGDRPSHQARRTLNYKVAHRGKNAATGVW
jgi:acetoin utilization protein AcuB